MEQSETQGQCKNLVIPDRADVSKKPRKILENTTNLFTLNPQTH